MTNKELQELLKQYPDDMIIYVPFDREGDNFQKVKTALSKDIFLKINEFLTGIDIEEDDSLIIY